MARENHTSPSKPKTSVTAILALVFSFLLPPLGVLLGILAIILIVRSHPRKRGMGPAVTAVTMGVLITGLGILGLHGFYKFIRRAKAAEAMNNAKSCWSGANALLVAGKPLPRSGDWTPPGPPTSKRYTYSRDIWSVSPWRELDFKIDNAGFFQYQFVNEAGRFVCRARGDVDDDGIFSLYEYEGRTGADGQIHAMPKLNITNELE